MKSLGIDEESRKIQKSKRKPVVIYVVSPEVIHAEASEFMALVQRLTGPGAASPSSEAEASASAARGDEGRRDEQQRQQRLLPLRVKARALNRSGSQTQDDHSSSQPVADAETVFFRDLSPPPPPSYVARKDEPIPSHSWLLHGEYLDHSPRHQPGSFAQGSPYVNIFGQGQDH